LFPLDEGSVEMEIRVLGKEADFTREDAWLNLEQEMPYENIDS
jgi:hypothetical protein